MFILNITKNLSILFEPYLPNKLLDAGVGISIVSILHCGLLRVLDITVYMTPPSC